MRRNDASHSSCHNCINSMLIIFHAEINSPEEFETVATRTALGNKTYGTVLRNNGLNLYLHFTKNVLHVLVNPHAKISQSKVALKLICFNFNM